MQQVRRKSGRMGDEVVSSEQRVLLDRGVAHRLAGNTGTARALERTLTDIFDHDEQYRALKRILIAELSYNNGLGCAARAAGGALAFAVSRCPTCVCPKGCRMTATIVVTDRKN
ncbi:MAG: hypothetical protein ACXV3D_09845 [Halobacteriota archaeon]